MMLIISDIFVLPWKILKVIKKTLELFFEKATIEIVLELLVPKGTNVDLWTLGNVDHLDGADGDIWEMCLELFTLDIDHMRAP